MLPQHRICKYQLNCEYCNITLARNKAPSWWSDKIETCRSVLKCFKSVFFYEIICAFVGWQIEMIQQNIYLNKIISQVNKSNIINFLENMYTAFNNESTYLDPYYVTIRLCPETHCHITYKIINIYLGKNKGEFRPLTCHEGQRRYRGITPPFLQSRRYMWGEWSTPHPGCFTPRK